MSDQQTAPPESTEDRLDRALDALHAIKQWCDAYPIDIFPEPLDLAAIREKIGDSEMSRLHASWARHITACIARHVQGGL